MGPGALGFQAAGRRCQHLARAPRHSVGPHVASARSKLSRWKVVGDAVDWHFQGECVDDLARSAVCPHWLSA